MNGEQNNPTMDRVEELLIRLGTDLTVEDFRALCLACADQAGVPARLVAKIEKILDEGAYVVRTQVTP